MSDILYLSALISIFFEVLSKDFCLQSSKSFLQHFSSHFFCHQSSLPWLIQVCSTNVIYGEYFPPMLWCDSLWKKFVFNIFFSLFLMIFYEYRKYCIMISLLQYFSNICNNIYFRSPIVPAKIWIFSVERLRQTIDKPRGLY